MKGISIPFWSDFNYEWQKMYGLKDVFQSHFGLILTTSSELSSLHDFSFQSHFGLILT